MKGTIIREKFLFNTKLHKGIFTGYIALMTLAMVLGFFNMQGDSNFQRGASLYAPRNNQTYGKSMTISGCAYAKSGVEILELVLSRDGSEISLPLERQQVKYRGEVVLQLATFQKMVTIPDIGDYTVFLRMSTGEGEVFEGQKRHIQVSEHGGAGVFKAFSPAHLIPLGLMVLFAVALILYARIKNTEEARQTGALILAGSCIVAQLSIMYYLVLEQNFRISYDLMLHLCCFALIALPVFLLSSNGKLREFLYQLLFIWGLGGALQAVLTPNLSNFPCPGLYYVCFFATHAIIISSVLYMTYVRGYRPKLKAFPKVLLTTAAAAVFAYGVNWLVTLLPPYEVGSYFMLNYPPIADGGTIIDTLQDVFGPSPRYIAGLLLLLPAFELVLIAPIKLADWIAGLFKQKSEVTHLDC